MHEVGKFSNPNEKLKGIYLSEHGVLPDLLLIALQFPHLLRSPTLPRKDWDKLEISMIGFESIDGFVKSVVAGESYPTPTE